MLCGWHLHQLMSSYSQNWGLLVAMFSSNIALIFHSCLSLSLKHLVWIHPNDILHGFPLIHQNPYWPHLTLHQQGQLCFYLDHFDGWKCCVTVISCQLHLSFFLRFHQMALQVSNLCFCLCHFFKYFQSFCLKHQRLPFFYIFSFCHQLCHFNLLSKCSFFSRRFNASTRFWGEFAAWSSRTDQKYGIFLN